MFKGLFLFSHLWPDWFQVVVKNEADNCLTKINAGFLVITGDHPLSNFPVKSQSHSLQTSNLGGWIWPPYAFCLAPNTYSLHRALNWNLLAIFTNRKILLHNPSFSRKIWEYNSPSFILFFTTYYTCDTKKRENSIIWADFNQTLKDEKIEETDTSVRRS